MPVAAGQTCHHNGLASGRLNVASVLLRREDGAMKKDAEVQILLRERHKGRTQAQAAAKAGMSERTARKYEQAGALPSHLKRPRTHRTRPDPFADVWPWIVGQLERDPALQAKTLFDLLCAQSPGRYQEG